MPITKASGNSVTAAAKGDLVVGNATNDSGILSVGESGSTLVADSSTSTGLRWQGNTASGKNGIINSAFDVWQRGTSFASSSATYNLYTADRFHFNFGLATTATLSRQSTNDTTRLPFIEFCARAQRNSGTTGTSGLAIGYTLENSDSTRFIGQTVTFSFYARAGANYSSASSALFVRVASGTGNNQSIATGLTGQTDFIDQTATLTTNWQRFTYTGTVSASAKQLGFYVFYLPTGTAGANDFFEITGFQLELGLVATAFARNAATLAGELAACQRYYYRATRASNERFGMGYNSSTTLGKVWINFPVQMRTTPTAFDRTGTAGDYALGYLATAQVCSSLPGINNYTATGAIVEFYVPSGLTAGQGCEGYAQNANAFLGFSAEL